MTVILWLVAWCTMTTQATPPTAKRIPTERSHHGDAVVDEYAWLAEKNDPDTIAYLKAENSFTEARTADQADLRETIFNEIKARTKETDLSVPVRKGAYWYYTRTVEGQQYGIHCRRAVAEGEVAPPPTDDGSPLDGEIVLLDGNVEAGDSEFFALGTFDVSPDGNLVAYSVDLAGDERFTLRVKDLRTGVVLADEVRNVFYGSAWSADASTLFYLTVDEAWRPHQVWRHTIGAPAADDVMVLAETDERFFVGIELSRSEAFLLIDIHSKVTSEVHVIPASQPTQAPRLIAPRRQGVEYQVEHDGIDRFLVLDESDHSESGARVEPFSPTEAFLQLVRAAFNVRLVSPERLHRQFRAATDLGGTGSGGYD